MANEQIGTYHLADNPDLYEVGRSNNFEFIVSGMTNLLRTGVAEDVAGENDIIKDGQNVLRLSVVKASVPHFTQEEIMIQRGNDKMYAAGVPTFGEGTLEVHDFIGADTKSILMAWQRLSYDVTTEKVGRMADYKRDCQLIEYTPDYQMVRYWDLKGCWVKGISEGEYSMEDSGKRVITGTIRFDKAIMHIPDEE